MIMYGLRMLERSSSANKLHAVGFERYIFYLTTIHMHQVKHPWRPFFFGTWTTCTKDRIVFTTDLCLNEQVAERGMCFIRRLARHHYFGIARNIQYLCRLCFVRN